MSLPATQSANHAPEIAPARPAAVMRSAGWFIRRTLIGVFTLSVFTLGGAWLLHASIEPDNASIAERTQGE